MSDVKKVVVCECGKKSRRVYTPPALQTDTNFVFTGRYDNRLCKNRRDKVEGRKDFQKRLDEKNLQVIDNSVFDKKQEQPNFCM
jgi:hypothetical protein